MPDEFLRITIFADRRITALNSRYEDAVGRLISFVSKVVDGEFFYIDPILLAVNVENDILESLPSTILGVFVKLEVRD